MSIVVHDKATKKELQQTYSFLKSRPVFEECPVYVHQFQKQPVSSQNNTKNVSTSFRKNELNHFYGAKVDCFKKQCDNLSLHTRHSKWKTPNKKPSIPNKPYPKIFSHNPLNVETTMHSNFKDRLKYDLFHPASKAAMDKLEESYWTRWKPNKTLKLTNKTKRRSKVVNNRKERGDCFDGNEDILNSQSDKLVYIESAPETLEITAPLEVEKIENIEEYIRDVEKISEKPDLKMSAHKIPSTTQQSPLESDSYVNINVLKHTDSFILNCRRHNQDERKRRYKQPKCIKLFRISGSEVKIIPKKVEVNYPLKSCLKENKYQSYPTQLKSLGATGGIKKIKQSL